jgi:two-component system NtrC family response regulator
VTSSPLLELTAARARELDDLRREVSVLGQRLVRQRQLRRIVGASPSMQEVVDRVEEALRTPGPVLLLGERGTGKTLVAFVLHEAGVVGSTGQLVRIRCHRDHPACLSLPPGGTLYLEDIEELDEDHQDQLLRLLVEQDPGGGRDAAEASRIIAASADDLPAAVASGRLRADLVDLLGAIRIELPPLTARRSDIPLLVDEFLRRHWRPGQPPGRLAPAALSRLLRRDWPGNVAELEELVARAAARMQDGALLQFEPGGPRDLSWRSGS